MLLFFYFSNSFLTSFAGPNEALQPGDEVTQKDTVLNSLLASVQHQRRVNGEKSFTLSMCAWKSPTEVHHKEAGKRFK